MTSSGALDGLEDHCQKRSGIGKFSGSLISLSYPERSFAMDQASHVTGDIQTRQYRLPEVILGAK